MTTDVWLAIERSAIAPGTSSGGTSSGVIAPYAGQAIEFADAGQRGEREERPELPRAVQRHDEQQRRDGQTRARAPAANISAARQPVGQLAHRQREQRQRDELHQADQAEVERVAVDREHLPADRDRDHVLREAQRRGSPPRAARSCGCGAREGGGGAPRQVRLRRDVRDARHDARRSSSGCASCARRRCTRAASRRSRSAARRGRLLARERAEQLCDPGLVRRARPLRPPPRVELRDDGPAPVRRRRRHRATGRSSAARSSSSRRTSPSSAARSARSSPRRSARSWTSPSSTAAP